MAVGISECHVSQQILLGFPADMTKSIDWYNPVYACLHTWAQQWFAAHYIELSVYMIYSVMWCMQLSINFGDTHLHCEAFVLWPHPFCATLWRLIDTGTVLLLHTIGWRWKVLNLGTSKRVVIMLAGQTCGKSGSECRQCSGSLCNETELINEWMVTRLAICFISYMN